MITIAIGTVIASLAFGLGWLLGVRYSDRSFIKMTIEMLPKHEADAVVAALNRARLAKHAQKERP